MKSTYTINTFTQSIHYEPLEEGTDTLTLLTWRYIDGYSTTYSEALALGNVGSTKLYLTINVNELPQRDKYYSSFTTYSTTRLSDQRYNLAYMRYREYLYSTGTNADKAEIIYNALIAVRGSLEAYRYNQQSKQLYKKLVAVAVKLAGEYGPLDDLLSQIC